MGLTQKLGTIPLAIQTDSSNNVGIGGAANASYKLDVIGTTRVSSALTISSTTNAALIAATNSTTGYTYLDLINNGASGKNYQIGVGGNAAASGYANNLYFDLVGVGNIMTLTSGRNVGIGTSSPNFTAANRTVLDINGTNESILAFSNGGTARGYIFNTATDQIYWTEGSRNMQFGIAGAGFMGFGTNNTERMRITSGGVVIINKTSADAVSGAGSLQVGKEIFSLGSSAFLGFEDRNNGTYKYGWYATGNTIVYFYSSVNGNLATINPSNGTYTALSDINKKKDFEDSTIGLNAILGLKPTLYRMKDEDESIEKHLGFIAQEVKEFIPQAYVESGNEEDKFIGLTDRPIIAALVKAVQELSAKVTALENK